MNCACCDAVLPIRARFCPSCGDPVRLFEEQTSDEPASESDERRETHDRLTPPEHESFKDRLIDCYVNYSVSRELSGWLQDLGLPASGTTEEKLARLQLQANSLVLPAESVPRQTIWYLNRYDEDILAEICQELGIDQTGSRDTMMTRIYREVGTREGWLQPSSQEARQIIMETFLPLITSMERRADDETDGRSELSRGLGNEQTSPPVLQTRRSAIMAVLAPGLLQEGHAALLESEFGHRVGTVSRLSDGRTLADS